MQYCYSPDEGNKTPHTATGNTWHSLTPNQSDSVLQTGNGPCGTKTHMVAARIHNLVFSATFNQCNYESFLKQEVSQNKGRQHSHAKVQTLSDRVLKICMIKR